MSDDLSKSGVPEDLTGSDRVLKFADTLTKVEEKEQEVRELETWVTCRLGSELFGVPVAEVQEVLRVTELTRVPHAPYPIRGVTNMRGHVLPVVDLRIRLGLEAIDLGTAHRIMVVASKGRLVGLLVDQVDQVVQIDRLAIEAPPDEVLSSGSYYILGVFQQADDLLILLDTDRVLEIRDESEGRSDD